MQEVFIDVTRLLGRFMKQRLATGVDRVSVAYVAHYQFRARAVMRFWGKNWVASAPTSKKIFNWLSQPTYDFLNWRVHLWAFCTFYYHLFHRTPKGSILFNTGHSGLENSSYPKQLKKLGLKPVFMVHDLIPITHPEYCRPAEQQKHTHRMNNILNIAYGIITNSKLTLDELHRYSISINSTIPQCLDALIAPAKLPTPSIVRPYSEPYFVVLGTIEPRKNHWMLLHLWRKLTHELGKESPKLIIIGQRGWECESVFDMLERCESIHSKVIELPICSDKELSTLLFHSQALLFPSFIEGYGMPLVEALSLGVPVLASDLPVFKEIAGNIPEYIDPLDGKGWLKHIISYIKPESAERVAQIQRLSTFVTPTWEDHFNKVDQWLESLEVSDKHN